MAVGDFNIALALLLDKWNPSTISKTKNLHFAKFIAELVWEDVLTVITQQSIKYILCYSKSHNTFSNVDMALADQGCTHLVKSVNYTRDISDHNPLVASQLNKK